MGSTEFASALSGPKSRWYAWHLHDRGNRNELLRRLEPLAVGWLAEGVAEGLFFVRYGLGGPHIRLRVALPSAEAAARCGEALRAHAEAFWDRLPPAEGPSDARILEINRRLLAAEPGGDPQEIVADRTVVEAEYRPEVERYGGPRGLELSHALFTLSSLACWAELRGSDPGPVDQLGNLLGVNLAVAADFADLMRLVRYPPAAAWRQSQGLVARADEVFVGHSQAFAELLASLASSAGPSGGHWAPFTEAVLAVGRWLGREIPAQRARVLSSHVHMTANRLGLSNRGELMLARLAERTLLAARQEPASVVLDFSRSRGALEERTEDLLERLHEKVGEAARSAKR
ncbi:MAG: thiopeptide-type bacteriocin biosynthesis protein [Acidobacteriota bacterium]